MRRASLAFLAGLFGLVLLGAAEGRHAIHFPAHGFSIAPLESPDHGSDGMLMTMFLPATDGFAANVNVMSQKSPGSIDQYLAVSKQEFEKMGWKIIKTNRVDDNTLILEFAGKFKDSSLHWYAKAALKGDEIILATATATEGQWSNDSAQLQACVDSFQRDSDN